MGCLKVPWGVEPHARSHLADHSGPDFERSGALAAVFCPVSLCFALHGVVVSTSQPLLGITQWRRPQGLTAPRLDRSKSIGFSLTACYRPADCMIPDRLSNVAPKAFLPCNLFRPLPVGTGLLRLLLVTRYAAKGPLSYYKGVPVAQLSH